MHTIYKCTNELIAKCKRLRIDCVIHELILWTKQANVIFYALSSTAVTIQLHDSGWQGSPWHKETSIMTSVPHTWLFSGNIVSIISQRRNRTKNEVICFLGKFELLEIDCYYFKSLKQTKDRFKHIEQDILKHA